MRAADDSLGGDRPVRCWWCVLAYLFPTVLCREAVEACWAFLQATGVVVEPACGAALAPLYLEAMRGDVQAALARAKGYMDADANLVVVVCGACVMQHC